MTSTPSERTFQFCPVCGIKYLSENIAQFDKLCSSCGFHFYENLSVAVCAVIVHDEKLLLTVRAREPFKGKYDIPGGFAQPNEHPEQAVIREINEELGVNARVEKLLSVDAPTAYYYSGMTRYNCDIFYLVSVDSLDFKPTDDISDYKWFPFAELPGPEELPFETIKRFVKELKSGKKII